MLEKSSHISNSSAHEISYAIYTYMRFFPHSLDVGHKTEFAFDHLPDVDNSDSRAVWSTISQVMGSSLI